MKTMQLRDAKASLSALVDAAERGEPTTVTRHGHRAAVLVPVADADRFYERPSDSFADFLLSFPGGVDLERDHTPMRDIDL